jgi:hypothetical protein
MSVDDSVSIPRRVVASHHHCAPNMLRRKRRRFPPPPVLRRANPPLRAILPGYGLPLVVRSPLQLVIRDIEYRKLHVGAGLNVLIYVTVHGSPLQADRELQIAASW